VGWVVQRWGHVVIWSVLSTTVAVTSATAVPAMAAPKVPGIDVSKYQGRIDWPAVASTPTRFVIIRATMGNRYRDRRYAENLSGATANGLVVGAYHFAKPGFAPWDARAEADHFLDVARMSPGDLVPVLDIEETGGLSPRRLRGWARAWLDHVRSRTGVRAMIYTGSHFWHGSMRNTSWFAELDHPLWVAHWVRPRSRRPRPSLGGIGVRGLAMVGDRPDRRHQGGRRPELGEGEARASNRRIAHGGSGGRRCDQRRSHRMRRAASSLLTSGEPG
jgi:GH25 family lysozyme M1 (1,4-beta-N-acetylmuramidase)